MELFKRDIFITGSNSYLLSGELATKLTGRYLEIELFPLTFHAKSNRRHHRIVCFYLHFKETVKMEIEEMNSTNWSQSVAGVCLKDGKVLLARHTYGSGKGKLIIPGGYVKFGELPEETLVREYLEETGLKVRAGRLLGIRFNEKDWYVIFAAEYIEGVAKSDGDENSEVVWMDIDDALHDDAVPGLTKALVECAQKESGFHLTLYQTNKVRNQLYV